MKRRTAKRERTIIDRGPADVREYLSTGSVLLDLCVAGVADLQNRGGIPVGRITEIFGPESSGKSYLAGEVLGSAQRDGFDCHLFDTEESFEFSRAGIFGLDVGAKSFHYHPAGEVRTIERLMGVRKTDNKKRYGALNEICRGAGEDKRIAVVVDTVEVLPSELEADGADKRGQSRAKAISAGFRTTQADIAEARVAVLFLNQARQKPGDQIEFGHRRIVKFESGGGQAIKHYPSVRIYCEEKGPQKDGERIVGVKIWAYVYKSKVDVPFRSCVFTLNFDYGIDNILDCTNWLREETELLGKKAEWFTWGEKKVRSQDEFIKYIEDNELEEALFDLTRGEWLKVHAPAKRKAKKRF